MYISYQGQRTMYQDIVDDALKRSERRRMLKDLETDSDSHARAWNPAIALTGLVRSMLAAVARP